MTNNRFVFAGTAAFFIVIAVYAVYAVFGILGGTNKYLNAQTQQLLLDLARTEIHNTAFQNAAKHYFLNPSEKGKSELKHLNNALRSRKNLLQPDILKGQFPQDVRESLENEVEYFDNSLGQLLILLEKPGLLGPEQNEIERHLATINAGFAYIYTESIIAINDLSVKQQAALKSLFQTIVILSIILVTVLLVLVFFILKFRAQSLQLKYEIDVKNRFFSIISHDLKAPFNSLLGMTQLMSKMANKFSKDQLVDYAHNVNEAGERFFELLRNLLEWSRLQMGGIKLEPESINLSELAQESIDVLQPIALEKDITLTNKLTKSTAFADREMVRTVIRNLITNALKFTQSGGSVEITSRDSGGTIRVTVSDTGVGMSMEQAGLIFSLDQTTSAMGTAGERGTGLGLPLCKDMLERNGGSMSVESTLGEGSQFHFFLPTGSGSK